MFGIFLRRVKKYSVIYQLFMPVLVVVSFVYRNNTTLWEVEHSSDFHVVFFPFRNSHKLWQTTRVIQFNM